MSILKWCRSKSLIQDLPVIHLTQTPLQHGGIKPEQDRNKVIQRLPCRPTQKNTISTSRTALPAVHLLLGALPLEAELHKKHLSLLYSIINSNNQTFH